MRLKSILKFFKKKENVQDYPTKDLKSEDSLDDGVVIFFDTKCEFKYFWDYSVLKNYAEKNLYDILDRITSDKKVLIVVSEVDEKLEYHAKDGLISTRLLKVPDSVQPIFKKQLLTLLDDKSFNFPDLDKDDIKDGLILIQSAYDENKYVKLSNFEDSSIKDKIHMFCKFAQALGAKKVSCNFSSEDYLEQKLNRSNGIGFEDIKLKAEYRKKVCEEIKKNYSVLKVFTGNPDVPYDDIKEEFSKNHLLDDRDIKDLFDARYPKNGNIVQFQKVRVELTKEINSLYEIMFSIAQLQLEGTVELKNMISKKKTIIFEFEIEF